MHRYLLGITFGLGYTLNCLAGTCPDPSSIQCLKLPSGQTTCKTTISGWSSSQTSYSSPIMNPISFTMAELAVAPDWRYKPSCFYVDANGVSLEFDSNMGVTASGSTWSPDPSSNKNAGTYTCNSSILSDCQINPS